MKRPSLRQWLSEVQRIIRKNYADIYGSEYIADKEPWELFYIESLSPWSAIKEDLSNCDHTNP